MKYIVLFLIISFSILAQNTNNPSKTSESSNEKENNQDTEELTQARIREKRKYEMGGGLHGLSQKLPFIRIGYNLSSRFSIGYTHFHQKKESTGEPFLFFPIQNINISGNGIGNSNPNAPSVFTTVDRNDSTELGLLHLRYYLSELVPFYATGGVGRDYNGSRVTVKSHGNIYPNGGSRAGAGFEWNYDIAPHYLYFIGLGFQWIFENGFFLGYEVLRLQSINQRSTNYIINYVNIFNGDLYGLAVQSLIDKGFSRETHSTFQLGNFWIGYSFPL